MQEMKNYLKIAFFFLLGAGITTIALILIGYMTFTVVYKDKIYPGIKNPVEINIDLTRLDFFFSYPTATISATGKELNLRVDKELMTKRAISVGRQSANPYYNLLQIIAAARGQINLPLEIAFDENELNKKIAAAAPLIEKDPVDAIYNFVPNAGPDKKGRVTTFRPSKDGLTIDREKIKQIIVQAGRKQTSIFVNLPTKIIPPLISSSTADLLGIKNLLGRGESYFYDSIPGRIYNIDLGTGKINGSLIAPNEIFSFNTAIGTVSAVFGFAKAYAIKEGKTVLDDGGGVCQVSTTLYRAVLNAGLPVIERHAHSYRVGFYEQGGFLPGMDATVYPPSPDLKFKNDTGGWILIQTDFDKVNHKLTFDLFGTSDGRQTAITDPVITSSSSPPNPIYEDDPNSPIGQIKQTDTAHYGAKVYFKRQVFKDNKIYIDETVWSTYIPWPARFLRGTKS